MKIKRKVAAYAFQAGCSENEKDGIEKGSLSSTVTKDGIALFGMDLMDMAHILVMAST